MPKKRVLIFPFDLLSHYLRCIVFAKAYYNKDEYEVLFLHSDKYDKYVLENGFTTFNCDQFDSEVVMRCAEKFKFSWLNEKDLERIFLSQGETIKNLKPDIVVGDVAPTLKMAAEYANVDYTAITNGYMTKYYTGIRKLSKAHPAYHFLKKLPEIYFDYITKIAENISFKIVHQPFKNIRKKYGLKKVDNYLSEMEGELNLICDLEKLFPQKNLPSNYQFIGPLIYKSETIQNDLLDSSNIEKPKIIVCMGSTGNWNGLKFLNEEYYAKYSIITGGDTDKILHANHILHKDFLNLESAIESADLMICHGGNGTIYFGLLKGVYMLCLTSNFEQEWNVQALERIGYGKSINDINNHEIKALISESLSIKKEPYMN